MFWIETSTRRGNFLYSFIAFVAQNFVESVAIPLRRACCVALLMPSVVGAVAATQVNDRAKIIANSNGTCIRASRVTPILQLFAATRTDNGLLGTKAIYR